MTTELDNVIVATKCRGETYDEADKRNKHFKEIGRQECIKEKDECLIQMKKQKDYWRDKYRKFKQEEIKWLNRFRDLSVDWVTEYIDKRLQELKK